MKGKVNAGERLKIAGLFAGIGGIEEGFRQAGHHSELLCEIDRGASEVLGRRFKDVPLHFDVRTLSGLPDVDVVAAGFPCQDLSQAGQTAGIEGRNSGLVGEVFRLLDTLSRKPRWLVLENVSFMLQLDRGRAMRFLVDELEARGLTWAYRVFDTRAFGLPQRRQRVILVASATEDPRPVLLAHDAGAAGEKAFSRELWCGFYWTEGLTGLGWAVDAVPTLKGGSTIGIPSPPAVWQPLTGLIGTPVIEDAEVLQGFPAGWTAPALTVPEARRGARWKLVGNAVSVPLARWVGERLINPGAELVGESQPLSAGCSWPRAAWGHSGHRFSVCLSTCPVREALPHLEDFLAHPLAPLSVRAASGFYSRAMRSCLRFQDKPGFLDAIQQHIDTCREREVA